MWALAFGILYPFIKLLWAVPLLHIWWWYLQPTFKLPNMSLGVAAAISILIGWIMAHNYEEPKKKTTEQMAMLLMYELFTPSFMLLSVYALHWMGI